MPTKARSVKAAFSALSVSSSLPLRISTPVARLTATTVSLASAPARLCRLDQHRGTVAQGGQVEIIGGEGAAKGAGLRWLVRKLQPHTRLCGLAFKRRQVIVLSCCLALHGVTKKPTGFPAWPKARICFLMLLCCLAARRSPRRLFKRIGLGTVLGYIAVGLVLGPIVNYIHDGEEVLHVAELGVVMLLFLVGLELQPKTLVEHAPGNLRARRVAGRLEWACSLAHRLGGVLRTRPGHWSSASAWPSPPPLSRCNCWRNPATTRSPMASGPSASCCFRTSPSHHC